MTKLRKGELQFYRGFTEQELSEYVLKHPVNTEYVHWFIEHYKYNYVKKEWVKK